jgi:hypothetical protein
MSHDRAYPLMLVAALFVAAAIATAFVGHSHGNGDRSGDMPAAVSAR